MITLTVETEQQIRQEGEGAWPDECCGFLLGALEGGEKRVDFVLAVENAREAGERYHRFIITPEDLIHAEKEARRQKKEILGIYHSHPDHPAKPSDYDREQALPFYSYVIVAVGEGRAAELTSWELTGDRDQFLEERVTLWR
ncbi:MAG: M67 family metallopeptidase [Spirochaetaceae bacterium]|jgi:proteasome lid subunit RPN8/RPN11|nr:M67 family metallopeptidase [Spirochaetaceae bacterium]